MVCPSLQNLIRLQHQSIEHFGVRMFFFPIKKLYPVISTGFFLLFFMFFTRFCDTIFSSNFPFSMENIGN